MNVYTKGNNPAWRSADSCGIYSGISGSTLVEYSRSGIIQDLALKNSVLTVKEPELKGQIL